MHHGDFRIKADFASFALFGFSAMDLKFRKNGEREWLNVLPPRTDKAGAACPACKTVVIFSTDYDEKPFDDSFAANYLDDQ